MEIVTLFDLSFFTQKETCDITNTYVTYRMQVVLFYWLSLGWQIPVTGRFIFQFACVIHSVHTLPEWPTYAHYYCGDVLNRYKIVLISSGTTICQFYFVKNSLVNDMLINDVLLFMDLIKSTTCLVNNMCLHIECAY